MADLHGLDDLERLELPGFKSPGSIGEVFKPNNDWQAVLSLTLITEASGKLLVMNAIRREETNSTHPGVVSTPTARLPKSLAGSLLDEKGSYVEAEEVGWQIDEVNPQAPRIIASYASNPSVLPDRERTLPFISGALMAGKLGCANSLEESSLSDPLGSVSLSKVIAGFSYASNDPKTGEALFEPLIMIGAVARILDPAIIPETTSAYRSVSWVGLDNYKNGFATKDSRLMIPSMPAAEELDICVRGLCLASSNASIADEIALRRHLLRPDEIAA